MRAVVFGAVKRDIDYLRIVNNAVATEFGMEFGDGVNMAKLFIAITEAIEENDDDLEDKILESFRNES